jgi:hypothetical protein
MGFFQPGTRRGMLSMTMGSRNTVPLRMFLMVPLGDFHIWAQQAQREQQHATEESNHGQQKVAGRRADRRAAILQAGSR